MQNGSYSEFRARGPAAATMQQNSTAPDDQGQQQQQRTSIPPADITVVTSAAALQDAVMAGATDIEIRAHLDLRPLRLIALPDLREQRAEDAALFSALMYVTDNPRSIRGNCSNPDAVAALGLTAADAVDLLPLKPFQCMLVMHDPWLVLTNGHVWVDNLYLRRMHARRRAVPHFAFISTLLDWADQAPQALLLKFYHQRETGTHIFVTNTTLQAGRGAASGVAIVRPSFDPANGKLIHVEDCVFSDWSGFASPLAVTWSTVADVVDTVFRNMRLAVELADVSFGGTVRFRNVSLADVELEHGAVVSTTLNDYHQILGSYNTYYTDDDAAFDVPLAPVPAAQRSVFGEQYAVVNATMSDCVSCVAHRAQRAELPGCPAAAAQARRQRYGCTDEADRWEIDMREGQYDAYPADADRTEAPDAPAPQLQLLDEGQSWLTGLKAVLPRHGPPPEDWPPFMPPPPLPPPPQPRLYPPISAAATPLSPPIAPPQAAPRAAPRAGAAAGIAAAIITLCVLAGSLWFWHRRRRRVAERALYMKHVELAEGGAMAGVGCGAMGGQNAAGPDAHTLQQQQRRVAQAMRQLDAYRQGGDVLLGRLELLPRDACLLGSQTIVQPAFNTKDGSVHMVKFFLSTTAFRTEATILAAFMPDLRAYLSPDDAAAAARVARAAPDVEASAFLPPVEKVVDNTSGRLRGAGGGRLPSLLVMGRAQSLQEWNASAAPDIFSSIAMLSSVAQRVACLHDAGYVHCALKPSKILHMSATRRWAISGFTHAARAGTDVPVSFTLAYAAPETVHVFMRGQRSVKAAPALDAWALGVIAFEALTGALAFDLIATGHAQVVAQLHGQRLLPWEGPRSGRPLERLGMLRGAVMHLLERDPAQRATPRQFLTACGAAFPPHHIGPGL